MIGFQSVFCFDRGQLAAENNGFMTVAGHTMLAMHLNGT